MYSDHRRDKDRDRRESRDRDRDRDRDRERDRDRYHGGSSRRYESSSRKRSRSPSPHSRSRDDFRDRDRERNRDKDRDRDRERERDRDRERERESSHKRERRRFTEDPNPSHSSPSTASSTSNSNLNSIKNSTSTLPRSIPLPAKPSTPTPALSTSPAASSAIPSTSISASTSTSSSSSFLLPKPTIPPASNIPTLGSPVPQASSSTPQAASSASISISSPNPSTSASNTTEDPKAKAKRERLQAWRKEQETKKALEEARLRALNVAAAFGGSKTAPTTINATGLKGLGTSKSDLKSKLATSKMSQDSEDSSSNSKKSIKKFALPPMDPLMKPGRGTNLASEGDDEPDLENDDGDDQGRGVDENVNDEDDIMKTMRERMNERRDILGEQEGDQTGGDVEMKDVEVKKENSDGKTEEQEEEEDELDAFMNSVKSQVKQVDAEDSKRFGNTASSKNKKRSLATVLGGDEFDGIDDEDEARRKNQENSDDALGEANVEDIYRLASKGIKKKEIQSVDHSKENYEEFRKNFYHEPLEIAELSEEKAEELRLELDAIQVRGKECPKPLTKWSHCGLPSNCLDVIKKLGYEKPTAIQSQAIPAIMSGRDVIGVAKTGSGKTMAFLLPMFRHIKDQRRVENLEGPVGIIMTPTRELAVQIYRESKPFLKVLGLRAVCVYGGAPISEQIAEMKKTAEIVVATPGRMIDLLTANSGRVTNLKRVTYLVLDEADRMFDMGFEPQVMKIINNIRPDRQTVLFSATFPKQMEALARKVAKVKPLEITVGGRSVVAKEIEQIIEVRQEETKFNRLLEILGTTYNEDADARTLIFVDRQESADDLLKNLMTKGYATMSLHGGKDQIDRDSTINDFKAGIVPIVTATSVAARGLDVKQLKLVINYDCPNHMEDYVHRAGRTGRAGNKGTCVTFITPQQDRYAKDIINALKASKVPVPDELNQLHENFKKKLAEGKAQNVGSGFGGKGLERLESDREKTLRAQQSAYGESGGDINPDDDEKKDSSANDPAGDIKVRKGPAPSDDQLSKYGDMKIEVKKGAAPAESRDNKVKASGSESTTTDSPSKKEDESKPNGNADSPAPSNLPAGANATKLAQALAKIQAAALEKKKNQEKLQEERENRKPKDPDATDYHAIVPINDFPQRARWRVTNKETMVMLIDSTGASITNKGVFYDKGKEPQEGDPPKLHLLIESNNEGMVEHAVREIKRILLEATQAALEAEQRNPSAAGRYQVI